MNSVTLGWVGAPNERAPLRVHDAFAVLAARCLTRTRIANQGLGGFHEQCGGFTRAIKFRVSCPGEFEICRKPCTLYIYILRHSSTAVITACFVTAGKIVASNDMCCCLHIKAFFLPNGTRSTPSFRPDSSWRDANYVVTD